MRNERAARRGFEDLGECVAGEPVEGVWETFACVDDARGLSQP